MPGMSRASMQDLTDLTDLKESDMIEGEREESMKTRVEDPRRMG